MISVPGDEELPLVEHLKELRTRMAITAVPIIALTMIAFMYSGKLLQLIWKQTLPAVPLNIYSPMELILTQLSLSLVCALFIGIPLMIYEAFMFVAKGLFSKERQFFIKIVPFSFFLFSIGAAIAYFMAVPLVFKYTLFYSTDIAIPQISVSRSFSTIIGLVLGFGIIFQFPLLLIFALKMGLLKKETLKKQRMIIYGTLFAFALFIIPDPTGIAELMLAVSLVILFEFSLIAARFF